MKRAISLVFVALVAISTSAQFSNTQSEVPAYHAAPPLKGQKLPPIASPEQVQQMEIKYPFQPRAYQAARRVPRVLYQLPCYCFCDRSAGHTSLHTCFEGSHGSHCATCMQEAFYAYQMTKQRKTPKQIREGVIRGDFKTIDLKSMGGPLA